MKRDWSGMIRRGIKKPPHVIFQRISKELQTELERYVSPVREWRMSGRLIASRFRLKTIEDVWQKLSAGPYPFWTPTLPIADYEKACPEDSKRIIQAAQKVLDHKVNFLGSGDIQLGDDIQWNKDYKTGFHWDNTYFRSIEYNNPDRPSDVKFPWELSRMQWMIPAGQAYLLTRDESYAKETKQLISDWIDKNPYAGSVNWSVTMEAALRIISWIWFFHVFKKSTSWQEAGFQEKFLCSLFLHAEFTRRHIERSDINGNHYTADAAGLVFAGLFFKGCPDAQKWSDAGWHILQTELPLQVSSDGVDFESSIPYHRFVLEFFFFAACYREACGLPTPSPYRERVIKMAEYIKAYTQPSGQVPLLGDADDARALPFGGQSINDHRYLIGMIGCQWDQDHLIGSFSGPAEEIFWMHGSEKTADLPQKNKPLPGQTKGFEDGGYYVLAHKDHHVFADCAPIGLGGRGGHGHNDCLSFEACMAGEKIITDCGAYLYTASYKDRNLFKSTAYHNTPMVDDAEINRFIRPDYLWNMYYDAEPGIIKFDIREGFSLLKASHSGYSRFNPPVTVTREFMLDHDSGRLKITDEISGKGRHKVNIPFHLTPGIKVKENHDNSLVLASKPDKKFLVKWDADHFKLAITPARVSKSYGLFQPSECLNFHFNGQLPVLFSIEFYHNDNSL